MFRTLFQSAIPKISPQDARLQIKNDDTIVLLDVRTKAEHVEKRIKGSINIPLDEIHRISSAIPQKDTTLFVYCLSGARASAACSQLVKMGYTKVFNLGGIASWPFETISGKEGLL